MVKSHDLTVLEESIGTFEAFCSQYDVAQFAADSQHVRQYDDIIARYAAYASRDTPIPSKTTLSVPVVARYRNAGMQAVKRLVSAESFNGDNGRQLRAVMPSILQNLYSETPRYLAHLQTLENSKEEYDKEQQTLRRTSLAITRDRNSPDVDPAAATGTAADADERARDDIAVLALQSLRQIFATDNPGQLRIATQCMLGFIAKRARIKHDRAQAESDAATDPSEWSTDIFLTVCRWPPVQYRYVVLVAAMDMLTRSSVVEDDLLFQLLLVHIIDALLRSSVSFIGLSVNDVLISFIQHVLLLLHLTNKDSSSQPSSQQPEAFGLFRVDSMQTDVRQEKDQVVEPEALKQPTATRLQLLDQLQKAIGSLATHIYYTDQISEMVSALISRLKPPSQAMAESSSTIHDPDATADVIGQSTPARPRSEAGDFFSFNTARLLALGAVRRILVVANSGKTRAAGAGIGGRVNVSTWDGTQWLLCDPDSRVRRAYIDALLTWSSLELDKTSLQSADDNPKRPPRHKTDATSTDGIAMAKRAVSNASKASDLKLRGRSSFLQLLHLAVYENALQYAESEPDMLMLHLLLVSLAQSLGVNAVCHGLPMIFRLQEDITSMESPTAKDAIGSLVHGYFWCLSEFFDFDTAIAGRDIANEISRRSQLGLWLSPISVPPLPLDRIAFSSRQSPKPRPISVTQRTQSLRPFTDRQSIVTCIAEGYSGALLSPPSSPPVSPRRPPSSHSAHSRRPSYFPPPEKKELPTSVKQQMLSTWSKEACIQDADKHASTARSLTDSKTGSGSARNGGLLAVDGGGVGHADDVAANGTAANLSNGVGSEIDLTNSPTLHQREGFHTPPQHPPALSKLGVSGSAGSGRSMTVVRVRDLKRILETGVDVRASSSRSGGIVSDVESDSMISADVSSVT